MTSQQDMDDIINNPELSDAQKKALLDEIRLTEASNAMLTGQLWIDQERAKIAERTAMAHLVVNKVIPGDTINFGELRQQVEELAKTAEIDADNITVSAHSSVDGPFFLIEGIRKEIKNG